MDAPEYTDLLAALSDVPDPRQRRGRNYAWPLLLALIAAALASGERNEIAAAPCLLAGRDLAGTVTTLDALLAQRGLAAQVRGQGGHYLMVAKANQPELHQAIDRNPDARCCQRCCQPSHERPPTLPRPPDLRAVALLLLVTPQGLEP